MTRPRRPRHFVGLGFGVPDVGDPRYPHRHRSLAELGRGVVRERQVRLPCGRLSGAVTAEFAAEVAETHFSDILHESENTAPEEVDEDVVPEDITELDENSEVASPDFVEEPLEEVVEDEDSAVADSTLSHGSTTCSAGCTDDRAHAAAPWGADRLRGPQHRPQAPHQARRRQLAGACLAVLRRDP